MSAASRSPAVRASSARDMLSFTDAVVPGTAAAVRAKIPPESLREIDGTPGVAWLPFEHDHWLMDGTLAVLGEKAAVRAWHAAMGQMLDRPVLRNFVQAGLRLFARDPSHVVQMLQRGWTLVYRDFCDPVLHQPGPGCAELRFERIAAQVFGSEGYLHCWHAVCLGAFDLARARDARVAFDVDRASAVAVATFRWS